MRASQVRGDVAPPLLIELVWYDERRVGLGDDLVAEVNGVLQELTATPQRFPLWPGAH